MAATVEYECPDTISLLYRLTMMAKANPGLFLFASKQIILDILSMVASDMLGESVVVVA